MATITTNVRIYRHTHLTEEKHLAFDDVTDYLEAGTPEYIDVSEVKLEKRLFSQLEVDFKFALDASDLADFSNGAYDYVKVMFKPGESLYVKSIFYFFVKACEWKSTGVIALQCKLDVLATFPLKKAKDAIPGALILKERTVTKRQHKDRFQSYDKANLRAIRRIDRFDEGINPILYRSVNQTLYDTGEVESSPYPQWNLVYRNVNVPAQEFENNPVECHLTLDEDSNVDISAIAQNELTPTMFTSTDGFDYILDDGDRDANDGMTVSDGTNTATISGYGVTHYAIVVNADRTIALWRVTVDSFNKWELSAELCRGAVLTLASRSTDTLSFRCVTMPIYAAQLPADPNWIVTVTDTTATLYGIHGLYDRTDPRLIKIVKVPYAPVAITYDDDDDRYEIPSGWTFDSSLHDLKLDDINVRFKRSVTLYGHNPWRANLLVTWAAAADLPAAGQARNAKYESKLLNSSFHMAKFVYDSFSLPIAFETAKEGITYANLGDAYEVVVDYVVSTTFSGNFAFYFGECATLFQYGATEDYPYRIAVSRNNQEPIFTSAYLNYVRTGYNYDVKAKNNQLAGSAIGMASAAAGMGASVWGMSAGLVSASTGTMGLIGAGIGLIATLASTINAQMNSENQIQQKLQTARMQAVTISASDDVDLLVDYSGNRLKYVEYDPSPQISAALFDLFHYFGYACNDTGIPDIKSRYYFNYLQADADIEADGNVPAIFVEEAITRIAEGVTVIHKPLAQLGKYETTYENWETSILTA